MIIVCAWCEKGIKEAPPFEDRDITHGICRKCRHRLANQQLNLFQDDSDQRRKKGERYEAGMDGQKYR